MFTGEFTADGLLDIVWYRDGDRRVILGKSDGSDFQTMPLGQTDGKAPLAAFKYFHGCRLRLGGDVTFHWHRIQPLAKCAEIMPAIRRPACPSPYGLCARAMAS